MVGLVCHEYFDRFIWPNLGPAKRLEAKAHNEIDLKSSNEGYILLLHYFEVDMLFLGLKVPEVSFILVKSSSDLIS